jgi:NPL4 family
VSAQCMALVRDDCFLPTRDAPELGYIRESTDKQYVPDVYYKVSTNSIHASNWTWSMASHYWDLTYFVMQKLLLGFASKFHHNFKQMYRSFQLLLKQ